jgi:hypothetical protein
MRRSFPSCFARLFCRTTYCWRLSGRSRLSGSILTWANPNRLRAARMASNFGAAGSTTSTVHTTGPRLPLPLTNKFPSSGNPASANARVTACVSSVYRAIRYRMDAKSLGLARAAIGLPGRSLSVARDPRVKCQHDVRRIALPQRVHCSLLVEWSVPAIEVGGKALQSKGDERFQLPRLPWGFSFPMPCRDKSRCHPRSPPWHIAAGN